MRLRLLVVGRGASELDAYEQRFIKRLRPFADFDLVELAEGRGRQVEPRRLDEEKRILAAAEAGFVLFDERGKTKSSRDWASFFERLPGNARQDFVIGGAGGVSEGVRKAASQIWSLSALTLPHQMVRALVLEQSYRAFSILQGHPYHRE